MMEIIIVSLLVIFTIVFFLLEIFFLPGISIAGVAGVICMVGAIVYAYSELGIMGGNITLAVSVLALIGSIYALVKTKALDRISLKTNIEGSVQQVNQVVPEPKDRGIAVSRLAMIGKVKIKGVIFEAKSQDEFIDEGESIEVVGIFSNGLIVRKTK